jgi:glucan 1,3-beta-glucosidase
LQPLLANVLIPVNLETTIDPLFSWTVEGEIPSGTYRVFAVLTVQGGLRDGRIDPGDVLAFTDQPVRFLEQASPVEYRMHGLDFSPYLDGQDPNQGSVISEAQMRARMEIIAPYTGWVRTFGCTSGLEAAGRLAHEMGLRVALGAWLSRDAAANECEIACLIRVAQARQVDLAIVGSEVLLRGDLSEAQLLVYLQRVKVALPTLPVSTAEVYGVLLAHPAVIAASAIVLANYYPYWEGVDVNYAVASMHA